MGFGEEVCCIFFMIYMYLKIKYKRWGRIVVGGMELCHSDSPSREPPVGSALARESPAAAPSDMRPGCSSQ